MRVIAGSAKSLKLKTVEGLSTRPTTDRIKETLFNMLNSDLLGCNFLDLFSGSGAIGIESLSRGAKKAVFVDNSKNCIACIEENLIFTKLKDRACVLQMDIVSAIKNLNKKNEIYDIIFMDPPYNNGYEKVVLDELKKSSIVDEYTTIVIEASLNTDFSFVFEDGDFEIYKEKKYKTNMHIFLRKK